MRFARREIRHKSVSLSTLFGLETSAFHSKYIYCKINLILHVSVVKIQLQLSIRRNVYTRHTEIT